MPRLRSLQVGRVAPLGGGAAGRRSGIDKRPVDGPLLLGTQGLPGDEVAQPRFHGGPERAVMACAHALYARFEVRLGRRLAPGAFGENLTVEGLDETTVRVGDVWRLGGATLEVSAPRMPCNTLALHLGDSGAVAEIGTPHRAGWYLRVRTPGLVRAGDPIELGARGDPAGTIERVAAVRQAKADVDGARALAGLPGLSPAWRDLFLDRVSKPGAP